MGYSTGGTLHLIANNQLGFTTPPGEGRSTRYSSDLAKGFDVPIIHVNADDPEAALSAVRLAMAFRNRFGHDVVIDLVGYRRFGHNEGDEPAYTQPLMYETIETHPTVREQYARHLVEAGVVREEQVAELDDAVQAQMREAHEKLRGRSKRAARAAGAPAWPRRRARSPTRRCPRDARAAEPRLLEVPEGFTVHPKL